MRSGEYATIDEFVTANRCARKIKRILIANNGNAALKFALSIRHWCLMAFNNEHEIELVGMVSTDDEKANAEYIGQCDYIARVSGGSNNNNYGNIEQILESAIDHQCDAVWPGWGHASENDALPRLLNSHEGIVWIGPSADTMQCVGCKIASTIIAQSIGVPTLKWSGSSVILSGNTDRITSVSQDDIDKACIRSLDQLYELIDSNHLDYPFMLKAAAGGGGKGIRIISNRDSAQTMYRQVVSEVPGSLIFAMTLVTDCRHLEVQIIADNYGNVKACGARDCTIQRRHQKIIEEGPPICGDDKLIEKLMKSAVVLCKTVGYRSAGTVEFIYDRRNGTYYFLEVNARLQVEHVVTEMLIRANLPAAQVQIAMSMRLDQIKDLAHLDIKAKRHCIAARVTAENAEHNFQPTTGRIQELVFLGSSNVWAYFSVGVGSTVHQYCDSQIGHIFSIGETRDEARKHLLMTLRSLVVRGEISTNVLVLQKILECEDYIQNDTNTCWLENSGIAKVANVVSCTDLCGNVFNAVLYGAVYRAIKDFNRDEQLFVDKINQGQVPGKLTQSFSYDLVYNSKIKFTLQCTNSGPNTIRVALNGQAVHVRYSESGVSHNENTSWYFMSAGLDCKHRRVGFQDDQAADMLKVRLEHVTYTFTSEKDPTQFRATYSAKLVRWLVPNESEVLRTTPVAEIELMKMYIQLYPDANGKFIHVLSEGAVFQSGDLLATMELRSSDIVEKPIIFNGCWNLGAGMTLKTRMLSAM